MGLLSKRAQAARIAKVLPWIRGSILNIGCGEAVILERLDSVGRYCGIEHTEERVERLRHQYPQHTFLQVDLDDEPISLAETFDTILLVAFVEHIYNQKHLFTQVLERLKPDGRIVITTPTPLGDRVHRVGAALGLFAKSAEDHHPIIFSKARLRVFAKRFDLRMEAYKTFALGCNQLVVLSRNPVRQSGQ
jgi:SAM-dependent methyltransferase